MVINAGLAAGENSGGIDLASSWQLGAGCGDNGQSVRVSRQMGRRSQVRAAAHDVLADKPGRSGFVPEVSSGSKALLLVVDIAR